VTLNWFLNIGIAITGVLVLVGWLRHRGREGDRNIDQAEISDDFAAAQELLDDALSERNRSRTQWGESQRPTPSDPPGASSRRR
jgi:hypothetical protein